MQTTQTEILLLDLIAKGENSTTEFKTKLLNQHDIARVLTAFANSQGGYLFLGIDDKNQIVGIPEEEADKTLNRLSKICSSLFSIPEYEVKMVRLEGKLIVYAYINKAPEFLKPFVTSNGESYIRQGTNTIKVRQETRMFSIDANKIDSSREVICFVAMSFRDEEEPSLTDYYNAMVRAAKDTELPIKLTRIDLTEGDFEISQQIMNEIDKADFVLSDFTLNPHNVYFELGYARGAKKSVIQTAKKGTPLQFDIRNWKTLFYRNATELEQLLKEKFKELYKIVTAQ